MTFREYILTIQKSELFSESREALVINLFEAAKSRNSINDSTAKSWIQEKQANGYRKCKIKKYFPNGKMFEAGFIDFLTERTKTAWRQLQEAFKANNNDEDCVVDLDTDNKDVFYWSLLNQFQKIHKLPLSDRESKDPSKINKRQRLNILRTLRNCIYPAKKSPYFEHIKDACNTDLTTLDDDVKLLIAEAAAAAIAEENKKEKDDDTNVRKGLN